jgi:hypothetical protein
MPPLPLMVLDGLADGMESVGTLRDAGDQAPSGLALVDEQDVVDALRELLGEGLVAAWHIAGVRLALVPCEEPSTDDESLRRYWFTWTPEGERVWREGGELLGAYWDSQPG